MPDSGKPYQTSILSTTKRYELPTIPLVDDIHQLIDIIISSERTLSNLLSTGFRLTLTETLYYILLLLIGRQGIYPCIATVFAMRAVSKMAVQIKRSNADKIKLFKGLFVGLDNAYGTYDIRSGQSRQVKAPVTDAVLKAHLMGRQPYGIYLLVKDKTRAIVADFDSLDRLPPYEFISAAKHYELKAYIESSKSKGYHTWIFFEKNGVLAWKARQVVKHILEEIEQPSVEIFPKQDRLDLNTCYGNFINAPLFGTLVPKGKTVFIDPDTFAPFPDQWDFLASVERHNESILDDIIELNGLSAPKEAPRSS